MILHHLFLSSVTLLRCYRHSRLLWDIFCALWTEGLAMYHSSTKLRTKFLVLSLPTTLEKLNVHSPHINSNPSVLCIGYRELRTAYYTEMAERKRGGWTKKMVCWLPQLPSTQTNWQLPIALASTDSVSLDALALNSYFPFNWPVEIHERIASSQRRRPYFVYTTIMLFLSLFCTMPWKMNDQFFFRIFWRLSLIHASASCCPFFQFCCSARCFQRTTCKPLHERPTLSDTDFYTHRPHWIIVRSDVYVLDSDRYFTEWIGTCCLLYKWFRGAISMALLAFTLADMDPT